MKMKIVAALCAVFLGGVATYGQRQGNYDLEQGLTSRHDQDGSSHGPQNRQGQSPSRYQGSTDTQNRYRDSGGYYNDRDSSRYQSGQSYRGQEYGREMADRHYGNQRSQYGQSYGQGSSGQYRSEYEQYNPGQSY